MDLIRVDEWNAGTPLAALSAAPTPLRSFYTRSNFGVPDLDEGSWRLTVDGLVAAPAIFSLDELRSLGTVTELVTVECAGNGRLLMSPTPDGTPWHLGGVSVGEFCGVPLLRLLEIVEPLPGVAELVFTGADAGTVEPEGPINYAFSLAADTAFTDGPLLAWEMNGEPLPAEHGAPLRLVVPGNYGMCSVKWLTTVTAIDRPFDGHFRMKYRFYDDRDEPEESLVGTVRVRSLITAPADGDHSDGSIEVRGIAWSGSPEIDTVALQIDDGDWFEAVLGPGRGRFAPTPWSAKLTLPSGTHSISSRATDSTGATQPVEPVWNRNGYANNVVHRVEVTVG